MHFLLFALFFSSCIFIAFKYFNRFGISILPAITVNYIVAVALGYVSSSESTTIYYMVRQPWILMAVITGITFILTFVVYAVSTQKVGAAMTVVSSKMSIVLSVAVGFILLSEPYGWMKILGIVAALFAFFLTNISRRDERFELKYLYLPALIFLGTAANDILMKLSGVYYAGRDEIQFLIVTFFTSFVIGLGILVYRVIRHTLKITWKDIAVGIFLGVVNWYSTYFFIKGLFVLPISLFIPVFNAALVFIAGVLGYFIFNEKLSRVNIIGIVLALVAIVAVAFSKV